MRLLVLVLLTTLSASAQPVTVAVDAGDLDGATLGVRGDTAPLAWDRSIPLTDPDGDGTFSVTLDFPTGTGRVGYKLLIEAPGAEAQWEPGDNRLLLPGRMDEDRRAFGAPQTSLPQITLSQAQMGRDLTLLRDAMQALHPGLQLHNTEAQLAAISERLDRDARALAGRYDEAIPMPEVYLLAARAVASLRDGHTQVSMYNQGALLSATLYARPDRAPFAFRLVGDRMIVTGDATPGGVLPPRTEILAMDGRPVADILAELMPYASADGSNDAKRLDELEVLGTLPPAERFDVIYSLLYSPEGDLPLQVRAPDGTERAVTVARTTRDTRREALWARDPDLPRTSGDGLRSRIDADGTAVLTIGTFATFNMDRDYTAWLTEAFRGFNEAGAERLIVDLREVAGGMDDAAALLFQHLLSEPAEVSFWQGVTAYERVPQALRPHVRSWSNDFYDLSDVVTPVGDGTYRMRPQPPVTVQPAPDAFRGPIAVLVDATASSATFYLAQQIQQTGAALLIGQTTGGSLKGLNAGQMVFLTLPNSGVVVDIPLFGARPAEPGPDRGVVPDLVVPLDADAVRAGRDPEMDAAIEALNTTNR